MYKLLLTLILTSAVATFAQKSTPKLPNVNDKLTVVLTLGDWEKLVNSYDNAYSFSTQSDQISVGQIRLILGGKSVRDTLLVILNKQLPQQDTAKPKQDTTHK